MTSRPRILYLITQSQFGGAQRYVFDLATSFASDFNVLVAAGSPGARGKDLLRECAARGLPTIRLTHLVRPIHPIRDIFAVFEVRALLKKTRPALVHVNSSKAGVVTSVASLFLPRRLRPKLVYTAHGWVFNEPGSPLKRRLYWFFEWLAARPKDAIICVSNYDRKTALEFRVAPPEKLTTIHNGVGRHSDLIGRHSERRRLPAGRQEESQDPSSRRGGTQDDSIVRALSIAHLYPMKGLRYLIEAMKIVQDRGAFLSLDIVGQGPLEENLKAKSYKLSAQGGSALGGKAPIRFLGEDPNIVSRLPDYDLYIQSSLKEGFPYTILEAMRAGLPIVATRVGGVPEAIIDGETGLLAKAGDAKDLAEKILRLIRDPTLAQRLGEAAKQKASQEFTLETMLEKTREVYLGLFGE